MNRLFDLIERLALVFLTFGIILYALLASKFWAADKQIWFLRTGDFGTVILISIGLIAFSWVMKWLLKWEIHSALGNNRRRKK